METATARLPNNTDATVRMDRMHLRSGTALDVRIKIKPLLPLHNGSLNRNAGRHSANLRRLIVLFEAIFVHPSDRIGVLVAATKLLSRMWWERCLPVKPIALLKASVRRSVTAGSLAESMSPRPYR